MKWPVGLSRRNCTLAYLANVLGETGEFMDVRDQ